MTANKRGNLQMLRSGFIVFGTNTNIIREIDVESEQWICDASIALEMWIPEGKDSSRRRGLNWTTPWHMAAREGIFGRKQYLGEKKTSRPWSGNWGALGPWGAKLMKDSCLSFHSTIWISFYSSTWNHNTKKWFHIVEIAIFLPISSTFHCTRCIVQYSFSCNGEERETQSINENPCCFIIGISIGSKANHALCFGRKCICTGSCPMTQKLWSFIL